MNPPLAILWPVVAHLALVQGLFLMVSLKRMEAAKAGAEIDDLAFGREPEASRRWARNLDNQFQIPLLFYVLVALMFATHKGGMIEVWLAWAFVIGRLLHSYVQVSADNVRLRGQVFTINYAALSLMWVIWLARMAGLL